MSCPLTVAPDDFPLFREGGKPPFRRRAFLHRRLSGNVKQIMTLQSSSENDIRFGGKA
jgi:hypothetical protein